MRKVWITGGKGFIGRNLSKHLARNDCEIHGIGHGLWTPLDSEIWSYSSWTNGDVTGENLSQLAHRYGPPDIIYHLAGGSSVAKSIENPFEDFQRTVSTTSRLLEWVRNHSAGSAVLIVSSAAVYGVGFKGPIAEASHPNPFSPYGFNKLMMEQLCASYSKNFGLRSVVVRLFSVYGAGLEKQLLWDVCGKLESDPRRLSLGGTGSESRDWLHVDDAAKILWMAISEVSDLCPIINGGTGVAVSTAEIVNLMCAAWGTNPRVIFSGIGRPGDPLSLVADCTRAAAIGFRAETSLSAGVYEVARWYREKRSLER